MCSFPPQIGSWPILLAYKQSNTAATRTHCGWKVTAFIRKHCREALQNLKHAQEDHQFSTESLHTLSFNTNEESSAGFELRQ